MTEPEPRRLILIRIVHSQAELGSMRDAVRQALLERKGEAGWLDHVERIETFGTFSCRRINGAASGRWSEHATANAIDIWGFRLSDGRTVNVKADWRERGAEGQFLEDVFSGGCDVFRVALGPDYNAAHADHFHFDMGPGLACE